MTLWFKDWLGGMLIAVVGSVVIALICVLILSLLGSSVWTELLLDPPFRKPEIVAYYAQSLMQQIQLASFAWIGTALAGFALWQIANLISRPSGPGQIRWSWRSLNWFLLLALVGTAGALAPHWLLTVRLDTVAAEAAQRLAAILGLLAAVLFWLLSVLCAGRMMRAAVPLGRLMPVR